MVVWVGYQELKDFTCLFCTSNNMAFRKCPSTETVHRNAKPTLPFHKFLSPVLKQQHYSPTHTFFTQ